MGENSAALAATDPKSQCSFCGRPPADFAYLTSAENASICDSCVLAVCDVITEKALETELKPCPFCGGIPTDCAIEPHSHSAPLKALGVPDHEGNHFIECGCGAGLIADTKEAVFKHWNTREDT